MLQYVDESCIMYNCACNHRNDCAWTCTRDRFIGREPYESISYRKEVLGEWLIVISFLSNWYIFFWKNNRQIIDLIEEAKTRSFWNRLSSIDQNNVNLYLKWHNQNLQNKSFVPTSDVLKQLWSKSKSADIVTSLVHPKFGSFSAKIEQIEVGVATKNVRENFELN